MVTNLSPAYRDPTKPPSRNPVSVATTTVAWNSLTSSRTVSSPGLYVMQLHQYSTTYGKGNPTKQQNAHAEQSIKCSYAEILIPALEKSPYPIPASFHKLYTERCALFEMPGKLKCFFFSEFDPVAGPKISCQVIY